MIDTIAKSVLIRLTKLISGVNVVKCDHEFSSSPKVYFANHSSHLDAVVIWSMIPDELRAKTRPVAARDYWESNKMNCYISNRLLNTVLVDRGSRGEGGNPLKSIDDMVEALNSGDSIIIFPEGTRGDGAEVKKFKAGIYHIASRMPSIEFVPVYLQNLNRILPKGEFLFIPLLGTIAFGERLKLEQDETKDDFLKRARAILEKTRGEA